MKRACIAVAAIVALWAPKAFARCEGDASCTKLDTLLAAPGASPFAAVGSSDVLSPWDAGFGFQLSYLRNPIAVLVPTTGPSGERLALVDRQVTGSWMFALGLGAGLEWGVVLDSVLDATGPLDFNPGFVGMIGSSALVVKNDGAVPFVLGTAQLSGVTSSTKNDVGYHALDLRVGAAVGWTFFRTLSHYAVARAFGGPVFWEFDGAKVIGTDLYKYQLGAGVSYMIANRLDLFVEGIGLG